MGDAGLWATFSSNSSTCGNTTAFISSVQLRSEKKRGGGVDDTATNNVRMNCTDGEVLDVEGPVMGDWLSVASCPAGSAISGVRLQIEKDQGGGDDTSVNNIDLMCTNIKHPTPPG